MTEDRANIVTLPVKRKPHQIIFLNGPRHSGKDTAYEFIAKEYLNVRHRKFAGPLKAAAKAMFNLTDPEFKELEATGNKKKIQPNSLFFGMSWVEVLIWLSEEVMKPKFGSAIFGGLMLTELAKQTAARFTVITDSGSEHEALPVINVCGPENCHVIRMYRPGYSFAGDSRSYIFENNVPVGLNIYELHNEHEFDIFKAQVLRLTKIILGE